MQKNKFTKFLLAVKDYIVAARFELIVVVASIVVDLISKAIVGASMQLYDSVTLIPHFLHVTYSHNNKAAFGSAFGLDKLLGDQGVRVVFIIISILAVGLFSYFLYRNRGKSKMCRLAYALIIGGAFGNLVDRLVLGYVRDFIQFEYFGQTIAGSQYFATFNIADACLTIGVVIFAIYYIFIYKENKQPELIVDDDEPVPDDDDEEIAAENQVPAQDEKIEDTATESKPTDTDENNGQS